MEEIEAKFLDIDVPAIIQKLKEVGAKKYFEKTYKRIVFDFPDWRLDKDNSWLRLRDEGDNVTMTFKKRLGAQDAGKNDEGMEEVEIEVSDFTKTAILVKKLGLVEKFYQENKRVRYKLDGIEIDIDSWPMIPPYLEIEAKSWEEIDETIEKLGLNKEDKKIMSTTQIYKLYDINDKDYSVITFKEQVKRK